MSDLTDYDREIVAAAEGWASLHARANMPDGSSDAQLYDVVQAKRDAQRPRCDWFIDGGPNKILGGGTCKQPAVQKIFTCLNTHFHRCDEHRIEVRDI